MVERITKTDVNVAEAAWRAAREAVAKEQLLWATLNGSEKPIIKKLLDDGVPWEQAEASFERLQEVHRSRIAQAWQHMDECADRYRDLLAKFKHGK
ncbi:hypothetical protein ACI2UK_13540 [Ralstonia nicotianae]|uniref:hypothetical protein n=1 Tax=Ralstonia pseudosolanacearum TaxID=1310165 RepID=UPI0020042208|nr:hypothetical protein [Ralstonia pseudosolanacearum]MCK4118432.1 hypothetical protein [Ralstonia pseudosolanacearum]